MSALIARHDYPPKSYFPYTLKKNIGHIRQSPNDAGIHLFIEVGSWIFISFASIITKALGAAY
jgi:hypothetical protein